MPGFDYQGEDPESFAHRDDVIHAIERYAAHIQAPIHCGVNVKSIQRNNQGHFVVDTGDQKFLANNVIVATGPYQKTNIPSVANKLPKQLQQLTASAYTNADALPPGGVLVVGAGGSGVQITEDLLHSGRQTYLCVGKFKRIPRQYAGRDIMDWMEELNLTNQPAVDRDPTDHSPLLTGVDGGYEVDLRRVVALGGTLLGRLEDAQDHNLILGDQLFNHMQIAETAYDEVIKGIETVLAARGEQEKLAARPPIPGPMPPPPPLTLNLAEHNITSVIWATGYGVDFSWINCGDFLPDGSPIQQQGVSAVPGLYYLGLFFMHTARSSFFWGVGDDAEHVVTHLSQRQ